MATRIAVRLKSAEPFLQQSRSTFIQTLDKKRQFEADCAVIIPELDNQWKEKILPLLDYSSTSIKFYPTHHSVLGNPSFSFSADHVVNFRHYLYNYTPQLLQKAITQLSNRLSENAPVCPVFNVSAYYKSLVQDLRRKEIARERKLYR